MFFNLNYLVMSGRKYLITVLSKPGSQRVSHLYLFLTFLKVGSIAWGGFMALIAVIEKQLVEKDKVIKGEMILDGISLASVLPGPTAFNVVTYVGYQLRGITGALISMTGVLLPSFLLVLLLSAGYAEYGGLPVFNSFFMGLIPAITAVVLSVAVTMVQKQVKDYKQMIICILAATALIFFHAFYITILIILVSGFFGYLLYKVPGKEVNTDNRTEENVNNRRIFIFGIPVLIIIVATVLILYFLFPGSSEKIKLLQSIFLTFSGMSITLFGGGYVMIPAMQQIVVESLHWLSNKEFTDAIAMGQITPGPILISATFIGYKMAGFWGALVATIGIFVPPGFIIMIFSGLLNRIRNSSAVNSIFKGMRPAITGMIISATFSIGKGAVYAWPSLAIFLIIFVVLLKFKVNVVYLIPLAGIAGIIFFK